MLAAHWGAFRHVGHSLVDQASAVLGHRGNLASQFAVGLERLELLSIVVDELRQEFCVDGIVLPATVSKGSSVVGHGRWIDRVDAYIAKFIFPTYNETFRRDLKPFSVDPFASKLTLRFATTHPELRATFWFDASNLFSGHGLQLMMASWNISVDHDTPGCPA